MYEELKALPVNPIEEDSKINKILDSAKKIREMLIHMRCPEFSEGVSDGFEKKFDDHLKAIISIANEVIGSDLPHFVGHVDDLFDEKVIAHAEFNREDRVFILGPSN